MKNYVYGVDIGGTTVKIGLFTTGGTLVEKWEIPTRTESSGMHILPDIMDSIRAKDAERGLTKEDIEGIGLGVPGPVLEDGTVVRCVNLGWGIFNVEEEMRLLTDVRVKAGNDANVAALGEVWQGAGRGCRNAVMVTLGTGVGGGVVVDGEIVCGNHGAAGEIGHITVRTDEEETCGCGKKGCLEQYTSANGIARLAKRYLASTDVVTKLRDCPNPNAKDVFDAAKDGDTAALTIVEQFGEILGKALAGISCVIDPDVIIIGGGVSRAGTIVTDIIRKYYTLYAFHASSEMEFRIAELQNDAGMYGAARQLL